MLEALVWSILLGFAGFLFVVVSLEEVFGFLSVCFGLLVWILISSGMFIAYKEIVESKSLNISKALENKETLICGEGFIVKNFKFDKEKLLIIDNDRNRIFELTKCEKYEGAK